jgi:hypothetical protein
MAGSGRPKKWIAGQQLAWFRWRIKSSNLEAVVVAQRCCASRLRSTPMIYLERRRRLAGSQLTHTRIPRC